MQRREAVALTSAMGACAGMQQTTYMLTSVMSSSFSAQRINALRWRGFAFEREFEHRKHAFAIADAIA